MVKPQLNMVRAAGYNVPEAPTEPGAPWQKTVSQKQLEEITKSLISQGIYKINDCRPIKN